VLPRSHSPDGIGYITPLKFSTVQPLSTLLRLSSFCQKPQDLNNLSCSVNDGAGEIGTQYKCTAVYTHCSTAKINWFVQVSSQHIRKWPFWMAVLKSLLMKPYSVRGLAENSIFNYRLSRARSIVKNVFGNLANR
jgi:hypothetical protein